MPMGLLHYIEIENFKRFAGIQRIKLDHPAVLIGPNNCGKTSAIQAIALWSQAVKTWYAARKESTAKERPATALNRLAIVSVPVQKTRYFWHNTRVHSGRETIYITITVGVQWQGAIVPVRMKFRHQGDELVYCHPDEETVATGVMEFAAKVGVELLYPMSGITTEEPVLKPGRISVLLGQGETAQVLRNLCHSVAVDAPTDWQGIAEFMGRLFPGTELDTPKENVRGSIDLFYHQEGVKEPLEIAVAGRGFQQMLLLFAYLFSHKRSVLLIDEPDAHLEILRQKQVYLLLREVAAQNGSQVIVATHSEVILDEALDHNLTLLLEGQADDLAAKTDIRNTLKHYGAEHYVKARERGYVLYVEGGTDIDMLRALAVRLGHRAATLWDERINAYYVQDNYPDQTLDSELERIEGGFGVTPSKHFGSLRPLVPGLRGLAILDNDGRTRQDRDEDSLRIRYWRRYEAENYFVTPNLLYTHAAAAYPSDDLFSPRLPDIQAVLDDVTTECVFGGSAEDYGVYRQAQTDAARLIWATKTERLKLSDYAEEFFRRLAARSQRPMLLRKGELHRLVERVDPSTIPSEVSEKLDLLAELFEAARSRDQADGEHSG